LKLSQLGTETKKLSETPPEIFGNFSTELNYTLKFWVGFI
jgi:hypothetical protein